MSKLWPNFSIPQKQVKELINFWNHLMWSTMVNLCSNSHINSSKTISAEYPLFHSHNFKVLILVQLIFSKSQTPWKTQPAKKKKRIMFSTDIRDLHKRSFSEFLLLCLDYKESRSAGRLPQRTDWKSTQDLAPLCCCVPRGEAGRELGEEWVL